MVESPGDFGLTETATMRGEYITGARRKTSVEILYLCKNFSVHSRKGDIECAYSLRDKVAGDFPKALTVTLRIFESGKVDSCASIGLQLQISRGKKASIQIDKIRRPLAWLLDDQACLFVHIDRLVQRLAMNAHLAIYEGLDFCHEAIA